jgi:hypothetical protein
MGRDLRMINPDMINSVRAVTSGWQVMQCGLPVDDVVYTTREEASDRARYLNGVEEQYFPVLTRVAQIVDALRRTHGIERGDAQNLVARALDNVREGDDLDLNALSSGRNFVQVR